MEVDALEVHHPMSSALITSGGNSVSSTRHVVAGRMRTVDLNGTPSNAVVVGRVELGAAWKILFPDVLHLAAEPAEFLVNALLALAVVLFLDLVGVVHVATAAVQALHRLHDLHVELHVLCLFLPIMMASRRWKWISALISFSGWKKANLMLL